MDVRMPDGTIVKNVPDGTTRAQLMAKVGGQAPEPSYRKAGGFRDSPLPPSGFGAQVGRAFSGESAHPVKAPTAGEVGQDYADIAGGIATGVPAGWAGTPGDIEGLGRLGLSQVSPVSRETALPTSSQFGDAIAGPPSSDAAATGRVIGNLLSPGAILKPLKAATGAVRAATKVAPPADRARQLFDRAQQRDKVSPESAAQFTDRYPDKPMTPMESGGQNVQRLGRTVATLPGEGSEKMGRFLAERQADQHARVLGDIRKNLADGSNVSSVTNKLIESRNTAAKPLYEEAFKSNQNIASPKIDRILNTPAGKEALSTARRKMQNDQSLMGVPDAELREQALEAGQILPKGGAASGLKLRTLDYVKRSLDDQIGAAKKAGHNDDVRILTGLKKELVAALDEADITARAGPNSTKPEGGLYKQARAAYSGPSQSLDAIEDGSEFRKMAPEDIAAHMDGLVTSDRDFYRIGASRDLQDLVSKAGDNHDAVARVFGNKTLRNQIETVFGKGSTDQFAEAMGAEKLATQTNRFVTGGSNTANKLADVADTGMGAQVAEDALKGFASGGFRGAMTLPALNMGKERIGAFFNRMPPDVRSQLADLLTDPNAVKNPVVASPRSANVGGVGFDRGIAGLTTQQILARLLLEQQPVQ